MTSLSKLPLLQFPIIVRNRILKMMDPIEFIAVSLCSKKVRSICKTVYIPKQVADDGYVGGHNSILKSFSLTLSEKCKIHLEFVGFMMKRWVFCIDTEPRGSENEGSTKLYSDSWVPDEGTYKAKITRLPILGIECSIRLHSSEDLFSGIYTFLEHLSDIFHFTISAMKLVLDDFSEQESRRIIDMFFGENSHQNPTKKLILENHGDINDQLVQSILKQQKATCILKLNTELSSDFHYDLNSLQNHVNEISVHNSEWVTVEDIINLEKARVLLLIIPTFTYEKIKKLIEKWRDGWMPKWEQLVIHTHETVDIDTYMLEEFPTINPPERMIQHVESGWIMGMDDRTAYSMLRRDGSIAKVTTGSAFVILSIYATSDRQYVDAHSIFK